MRWLLDTSILSEIVRARPRREVIDWIASQSPENLAISIVTLAEFLDGATASADEARRRNLTAWIENEIVREFRERTLTLTAAILLEWLRLNRRLRGKGLSGDAADLLIAATARVHELIVVTRNVRHFANTGVIVYDPWNGKTHAMDAP